MTSKCSSNLFCLSKASSGNNAEGSSFAIIDAGCSFPRSEEQSSYAICLTRNSSTIPKLCRYSCANTINRYELYSSMDLCCRIISRMVLFTTITLDPRIWYAPILLGNPCRIRLNPALCILNLALTANFTNSKAALKSFNFNICSRNLFSGPAVIIAAPISPIILPLLPFLSACPSF
jgi:hypothetical protein